MPFVDAFLAFALTMLSLATLVTLALELFHQFRGQRTRGLWRMLSVMFEKEILPRIDAALAELKEPSDELHAARAGLDAPETQHVVALDILKALTKNPMLETKGGESSWYSSLIGSRYLKSMTKEELLMRLDDLDIVKLLKKEGKLSELSKRIEETFDTYADLASEAFSRNARIWSFVLGIAIAVVLQVNAVKIFNHYLANPEATSALIGDAKKITERAETVLARSGEDTKDVLEQLSSQLEIIGDQRLPISPIFGSFGSKPASADKIAIEEIPIVIFTGLLIGLGGPFWRRVVQGAIESRRLLKATTAPSGSSQG